MTSELPTWERPFFVEGGGAPFLFYVVYGDFDFSTSMSRGAYRSNGAPSGVDLMSYGPDKHPEVPASFREGYIWDQLVENEPALASDVAACNRCVVLRGTPHDASTLNYLRDTVGLITYLLDNGGCAVYDLQMIHWWSPESWKEKVFSPDEPALRQHAVILLSEEESETGVAPANAILKWFHTRGMRKFGRPDISVHDVSIDRADAVVELCNRLIEHQALGHIVEDGQEVRMPGLPDGGVIRHAGDLDDPDFNNVHLDVRW